MGCCPCVVHPCCCCQPAGSRQACWHSATPLQAWHGMCGPQLLHHLPLLQVAVAAAVAEKDAQLHEAQEALQRQLQRQLQQAEAEMEVGGWGGALQSLLLCAALRCTGLPTCCTAALALQLLLSPPPFGCASVHPFRFLHLHRLLPGRLCVPAGHCERHCGPQGC